MICRLIAPEWLIKEVPTLKKVIEGDLSYEEILEWNKTGYNCYYRPNTASSYTGGSISGEDIDTWTCVFVDFDLKSGAYGDKDAFIVELYKKAPEPSKVVDSGGGIHAYWKVSDLDAKSYLRLQRRLMRLLNTDPAVGTIAQLMRLENTVNTKDPNNLKLCQILTDNEILYTCEQLDKILPTISLEDEKYCVNHYNQTYSIETDNTEIDGKLPAKFGKLLQGNAEANNLFSSTADDRSKNDYRLGHIMLGNGFTKVEAMNVLYNSAKAMQRNEAHRYNYAKNIVDKIWTYEEAEDKSKVNISPTVRDILKQGEDTVKGARFPCHKFVDDTKHGFRLGQVIGIVGGSGVGKTTLTLNFFLWFSANNPNYHHFFFSLEQPSGEIASRIRTICDGNDQLYDRIHIVSNYNDDGSYANFSMHSIEEHILAYEKSSGNKVGTIVVDHIGILDKSARNGESEGLMGICKEMKKVAVSTKTMVVMLSQAPREKAGIGDLELNKDAAFGTVFFEGYCDYLITLWQPLKRVYTQGAPTVMAFKFGKIRHKSQKHDRIKEDVCYQLFFDPETEQLREMTQEEDVSAKFFTNLATSIRKLDKKTEIVPYVSRRLDEEVLIVATDNSKDSARH